MSRREAAEFEERLQRAARGETVEEEWAPLIETAQQATMLADPPPHRPTNSSLAGNVSWQRQADFGLGR